MCILHKRLLGIRCVPGTVLGMENIARGKIFLSCGSWVYSGDSKQTRRGRCRVTTSPRRGVGHEGQGPGGPGQVDEQGQGTTSSEKVTRPDVWENPGEKGPGRCRALQKPHDHRVSKGRATTDEGEEGPTGCVWGQWGDGDKSRCRETTKRQPQ